jgi:hypothetical protein
MSSAPHSPHDDPELTAPDPTSAPALRALALERAVRWEPVDDVVSTLSVPLGTISSVEPLILHQQALAEIEAHAAASRSFAFGVLYGEIYRCPRLHLNYVLVEGVERGNVDEAPPNADLRSALAIVVDRLHASGVRSVGWYRTGASVRLHLSPADVAMHTALFPEPWAVALVRDALIVRSTAAFFRLIDRRQPYPIPFYEQLAADAHADGERPRTAIAWSSYHTMTDVLRPETPNAPLPLFDAQRIRRTPSTRSPATGRPPTTRAKPFEPAKPGSSIPLPTPAPEPVVPEVEKPAQPQPGSHAIDRIFDPAPATSRHHEPYPSSRSGLFHGFSLRPRVSIRALTLVAIALAIIAAWYFTH